MTGMRGLSKSGKRTCPWCRSVDLPGTTRLLELCGPRSATRWSTCGCQVLNVSLFSFQVTTWCAIIHEGCCSNTPREAFTRAFNIVDCCVDCDIAQLGRCESSQIGRYLEYMFARSCLFDSDPIIHERVTTSETQCRRGQGGVLSESVNEG